MDMDVEDSLTPLFRHSAWTYKAVCWDSSTSQWRYASPEDGCQLSKISAKILSLNVWFDNYYTPQRMKEIGRLVVEHDPDLIVFQELTPYICQLLFSQDWAKKYFISDIDGAQLGHINPAQPDAFRYGML